MKRCKRAVCTLLFLLLFGALQGLFPVQAAEPMEEDFDFWAEKLGCDDLFSTLPEEVKKALAQLGVEELNPELLLRLTPGDVLTLCQKTLQGAAQRPVKLLAFFVGLIVLGGLFEALTPSARGLQSLFDLLKDGAFCTAVCLPISACITAVFQTVQTAFGMTASFLPAFLSVLATSGRTLTAAAASAFLYGVLAAGPLLMSGFFLPFLRVHLVLRMAGGSGEETGIRALTDGAYQTVTGLFSGGVSLTVGLWSVQKSMASAADSAALRTGKWAVSGLVPVVGGSLSEAVAGLSGCLTLLKTTVGSLSCLSLVLLFFPALFESICWLLLFGTGRIFAGMLGSKTAERLFEGAGQTQKMLVAVTSVTAAFLLLSLGILISG